MYHSSKRQKNNIYGKLTL